MATFNKKDGTEATFDEWLAIIKSSDRVVGYKIISVNGKYLFVNAYFSGIGSEPKPFEITVTGDAVAHPNYHGYHDHADESDCLTKYNSVVTAIEAGDSI